MTVAFEKNPDGSVSLAVSAEIASALALADSGSVTMDLHDGDLVIRKAGATRTQQLPKFTMDELLEGYDLIPKDPEEERIWLNSPPVGRELI